MLAYLYAGVGLAMAASVGFNVYQGGVIDRLEAEQVVTEVELQSCGNQLVNILEDIADDREIDNLTADDLRNPPAHWLLPSGTD